VARPARACEELALCGEGDDGRRADEMAQEMIDAVNGRHDDATWGAHESLPCCPEQVFAPLADHLTLDRRFDGTVRALGWRAAVDWEETDGDAGGTASDGRRV